jgi:hypothetical protein
VYYTIYDLLNGEAVQWLEDQMLSVLTDHAELETVDLYLANITCYYRTREDAKFNGWIHLFVQRVENEFVSSPCPDFRLFL